MRRSVLLALALVMVFSLAEPGMAMALSLANSKEKQFNTDYKLDPLKSDAPAPVSVVGEQTAPTEQPKIANPRGHKSELADKRTAHSSTYLNNDGTKTLEFSAKQRNFRKNGRWEKLDNKLNYDTPTAPDANLWQLMTNTRPQASPVEEYRSQAGNMSVKMQPLAKGVHMAVGGKTITLKPIGANNVRPEKRDNGVVYRDAWKGVDLEYLTVGETLKENIIVKSKDAVTTYEFKVNGSKLIDDPANPGLITLEGAADGYHFAPLTLATAEKDPIDAAATAKQDHYEKSVY